ncbi:MAG: peptidoglycan-binding protein [Lachnospiraceae bacterium]|nr:peptidoglycan-binding protein [Lachnospiraceae bacterium]
MSVASDIYNRLRKAGLTEAGAAGLMGNLKAESGLKSTNVEDILEPKIGYNDETYTAAVDSGKITRAQFLNPISGKQYGYGLAQWTSPGRKAGLYDLCKSKGKSIGDLETQIEWLLTELKTSYSGVFKTLTSTKDVRTASNAVLTKFEIPADTGASVQETRYQYSMQYYNEFATGGKVVSIHYISNSGHDENNGYTGGKAGDQTGGEWELRSWYNRPWNCILRHPDPVVRQYHADMASAAAKNDKIGYNQGQRDTFGIQLKAAGDDPAKITVACEADCSKGIIDITKAIGRKTGRKELENIQATYTGNMRSAYKNAGYQVLTDSKYLTSPDYLLPGDILLNDVHHTATNISMGSKADGSTASSTGAAQSTLYGDCSIPAHWFLKGAVHPEIKSIQRLLNAKGYKGKDGKKLTIDGELGDNTAYAIERLQRKAGLPDSTNWGTVAGKTWSLLLN